MGNWTLETISWDRFDASKVDPEILRNIKAAALVERNAEDYGVYLGRVFATFATFASRCRGVSGTGAFYRVKRGGFPRGAQWGGAGASKIQGTSRQRSSTGVNSSS